MNHGHLLVQRAGKWETIPIDQSTQFVPLYLFIAITASRSPFCGDILGIRPTMREIDFFDLIPGSEKVEEDRLVHPLLAEFEVVPMYHRFGTYFAGTSCQVHPVVRAYKMPLNSLRGSHRGRPICGFVRGRCFRTIFQRSSQFPGMP